MLIIADNQASWTQFVSGTPCRLNCVRALKLAIDWSHQSLIFLWKKSGRLVKWVRWNGRGICWWMHDSCSECPKKPCSKRPNRLFLVSFLVGFLHPRHPRVLSRPVYPGRLDLCTVWRCSQVHIGGGSSMYDLLSHGSARMVSCASLVTGWGLVNLALRW